MLPATQLKRALTNCFSNLNRHLSSSSLLEVSNTPSVLRQVHIHGPHHSLNLSSEPINYSAVLGRLDLASNAFDSIDHLDTHVHKAVLQVQINPNDTFTVYWQMLSRSVYPDESMLSSILRASTNLDTGAQIHCHVVTLGFDQFPIVDTALVEMYVRCRGITNARQVFERMPDRDLCTWNEVISWECEVGNYREGIRLFERMRLEGLVPDSHTIISFLCGCVRSNNLGHGKSVHTLAFMNGLGGELSVGIALITMYCELGCLVSARALFDRMEGRDCAVWNVMISGYSWGSYPDHALELLVEMVRSGVGIDMFAAIASLASVSQLKSLAHGRQIHGHIIRNGSDCEVSVRNSLIEMYCNCKSLETARDIFDSLTMKNVLSWRYMIKGYLSNERVKEALVLFGEMRRNGVKPDSITLIDALSACVDLGAAEQVKNIHGYSIKQGLNSTLSLCTALLVSYSKCGCLELARKLFEEQINQSDVTSWNSIIGAYSKHGNWSQCFELYNRMKDSEVRPDRVTFLALLTACVNSGLVKEGWKCFVQMVESYELQPDQEHYACMVDLLERSGQLDQAKSLVGKLPSKANASVWGPLLSACKSKSATTFTDLAIEKLIQMEPKNAGNYVLISNIYAAMGNWAGVAKIRGLLRSRGLRKDPGSSWLEVNGKLHEFLVMDYSHPQFEAIYSMLNILQQEVKNYAMLHSEKQTCYADFGLTHY